MADYSTSGGGEWLTTKDYLRRIKYHERRINNMLDQIEALRSLRERTTASITGMPRGGQSDALTETTERIISITARLFKEIHAYLDLRTEVHEAIRKLSSPAEQCVIECVYVNHLPWTTIADDMRLTVSGVHKLHGRALQSIKKYLQTNVEQRPV